jgi:hypothetical protein
MNVSMLIQMYMIRSTPGAYHPEGALVAIGRSFDAAKTLAISFLDKNLHRATEYFNTIILQPE